MMSEEARSIEEQSSRGSALLVAMRDTPGLKLNSKLPFATSEVEMLNQLCPVLEIRRHPTNCFPGRDHEAYRIM
jgi:hypothetical protein